MLLSKFQKRFIEDFGIIHLMEDLGDANSGIVDVLMLGGGNPAHIPQVEQFFQKRLQDIASDPVECSNIIGNYDPPRGENRFIEALSDFFVSEYGWDIGPQNIALTAGSQAAFFLLFNMFSGEYTDGSNKKILLPMLPEYIGYCDLGFTQDQVTARVPVIEKLDDHYFKYHVDFERLSIGADIGAMCVSRPTNPTGNVLSDFEIDELSQIAKRNHIPLIIDNAYGMPFPNVIFTKTHLTWDSHIVLCMSLSKLGMPGVRTGIIIANEEIIKSIVNMNAIFNLAVGSFGPALALEAIRTKSFLSLSKSTIRSYYEHKASLAVKWLKKELSGINYFIHKVEGAIFIWLWLPGLPITCEQLYQRLKIRGVIVVPGNYFFPGLEEEWKHQNECLRISYAMDEGAVEKGIKIIGEEVRMLYK